MVMKRHRVGSGRGLIIIRSSARHRAKNVDLAARKVEETHAAFNPEGINPLAGRPTRIDPFAAIPGERPKDNAQDAAQAKLGQLGQSITDGMGLSKGAGQFGFGRGAKVDMRMGDAMAGPNGTRLIPKPNQPAKFLKGKK